MKGRDERIPPWAGRASTNALVELRAPFPSSFPDGASEVAQRLLQLASQPRGKTFPRAHSPGGADVNPAQFNQSASGRTGT
jgi:hypothetical protein